MKQFFTSTLTIVFTLFSISLLAQNLDNPGGYMNYISKQQTEISKKYLSYNSASSHGKSARKVDNLRAKLLNEVQEATENISSMPSFKGDIEYRDSAVAFMKMYYSLLNDDYSKIINMEELAEQSYNAMETWLLAKELVSKKMKDANARLYAVQVLFATKYGVTLNKASNDISEKMDVVDKVDNYYDELYLIFFKNYIQETYLLADVEKKNVNGIEQGKNTLLQYAQAGLTQLDAIKPFKGDNSLVNNAKNLLQFYSKECNDNMSSVTDYILKTENFAKLKINFEGKSNHSKDDVDSYNKAVNELNTSVNNFNNSSRLLNEKRNDLINKWNSAVSGFFDNQMPTYKD